MKRKMAKPCIFILGFSLVACESQKICEDLLSDCNETMDFEKNFLDEMCRVCPKEGDKVAGCIEDNDLKYCIVDCNNSEENEGYIKFVTTCKNELVSFESCILNDSAKNILFNDLKK